jgi:hypothetical protein
MNPKNRPSLMNHKDHKGHEGSAMLVCSFVSTVSIVVNQRRSGAHC